MVKVTAAEVNKLRKATGAGMMDCKKALVEAEGDFDKAIENREPQILYIKLYLRFTPEFLDEPRTRELLQRIGLPT